VASFALSIGYVNYRLCELDGIQSTFVLCLIIVKLGQWKKRKGLDCYVVID
jgi:hypothetical protein